MKISNGIKIISLRTIAAVADALGLTKKFSSDTSRKCLIISTTGIGDTIWGTPALRALKEQMPGVSVSALVKANNADLLRGNPHIDRIHKFRKGFFNVLLLLKELRSGHFDTVIVFHATDRIVWLLAYLTGAGRIIGSERHCKETGFVITHPVNIPHNTHAIRARHLLIKKLGLKPGPDKIELFITDDERKRINDLFRDMGLNGNSFIIGFQPGAAKAYKRWPADHFVKLGRMLSEAGNDIRILITGDIREQKEAQEIADDFGGISLAGRLTLRETSAAIEKCDLFITNDTGPMHIAVALGTPTIAIFSATGRENVAPYRSIDTFSAISKPKPCRECVSKACGQPVCMEQITPEEVFEEVRKRMDISRAKKPGVHRVR